MAATSASSTIWKKSEGSDSRDALLDHPEDRVARFVVHPDADGVARLEERRLRRAFEDGLDGADLGDAGIAEAAVGDRLAGAAIGVTVGDRARTDDRARRQVAGPGEVGDEGAEIEGHVIAGVGAAERRAVEIDLERARELAVPPALAQLVGRHEDGGQRRGGLGLEEAEALG